MKAVATKSAILTYDQYAINDCEKQEAEIKKLKRMLKADVGDVKRYLGESKS